MLFIKKLFLILITLIILLSCQEELQNLKSESFDYSNSFSKGPISLEMKVDKTEINIAGKIKVLLLGKSSDGWKPSFPELAENLDKFSVLEISDSPSRIEDDGSIGISRTIEIKPFLRGEYSIPPLSLEYSDKENNKGFLLTTPVSINVVSLLPENTENLQLKEIKEPDTFNYRKLFLFILIGILVLGGALLLFFIIRKRKRSQVIPGIPPYEEAFAKLTYLLDKNLPGEGRFKEFYFQLNLIVRIYIEKQFSIRAPEQTTEEFLQDLSVSSKISDEFKLVLKDFLIHSDLVKFAMYTPEGDELKDSIESCKNFIRVTGEMQ